MLQLSDKSSQPLQGTGTFIKRKIIVMSHVSNLYPLPPDFNVEFGFDFAVANFCPENARSHWSNLWRQL